MTLKVYHLKTCDTCRKAIKALRAAGHAVHLTDVRADGVSPSILKSLIAHYGWETVVNRRSTTWRDLNDDQKTNIDNTRAISLILEHPTLLKRPVIMSEDHMTIGWAKDVQAIWI